MFKRINSRAIKFDGVDDRIMVPNSSDRSKLSFGQPGATEKPFSISAWIFVEDVSEDATSSHLAGIANNANGHHEYILARKENDEIIFYLYDVNEANCRLHAATTGNPIQDSTWYHVVGTYDGSKSENGLKIYVDGAPAAINQTNANGGNYAQMRNEMTPFTIGGYASNAGFFEDRMADVCIFDKELTAAEVAEIYNSGKVKDMTKFSAYDNIVSWWKMGDDQDSHGSLGIKDYVGRNHGTLQAGKMALALTPWLDTDLAYVQDLALNDTKISRTIQVKNATGINMSMPTYTPDPPADLGDASLGYPTGNQRYLHVAMDTFPGVIDNNVLVLIWGYSHAMGRWAKLRKHASGFQNLHYNNNARLDGIQHGQNSSQSSRYVFEIAGIDRIYPQVTTVGAGAHFENQDKFFMGFNTF